MQCNFYLHSNFLREMLILMTEKRTFCWKESCINCVPRWKKVLVVSGECINTMWFLLLCKTPDKFNLEIDDLVPILKHRRSVLRKQVLLSQSAFKSFFFRQIWGGGSSRKPGAGSPGSPGVACCIAGWTFVLIFSFLFSRSSLRKLPMEWVQHSSKFCL